MKNPLLVVLLLATGCFQLATAQVAHRLGDAASSGPGDPACGWGFLGAGLNCLRGKSPSPDPAASVASQHAAEMLQDEEEIQARAKRRGNWKCSSGMFLLLAVGLYIFLWAIGGCTDKRASGVRQPLIVRMNAWADLESPITVPSDRLASVTYTLLHDSSGVAAGQAFMQKYPTFKVSQDNKCTVCFDRAIDVVLDPCGHIIACGLCAQSLNPQRCPVCREDIQQILSAKGGDSHNGTSLEQPRVEAAS